MSDDELINTLVDHNLTFINLQRKCANFPLSIPALPPETRKHFDNLWREAVKRNLHEKINAEVNRILDEDYQDDTR